MELTPIQSDLQIALAAMATFKHAPFCDNRREYRLGPHDGCPHADLLSVVHKIKRVLRNITALS
jgi:hypothetical protein